MPRRSTSVAAAAAAVIALAGCGASRTAAAPAQPATTTTTPPVGTSPAPGTSLRSTAPSSTTSPGACTAADITPSLGAAPAPGAQITIPLRYTNTGSVTCTLTGYPGATLQGPDQPLFGPRYELPRSTATPPTTTTLTPGQVAVAALTLGTVPVGDPSGWQATELLTIAPGDTTVMTVPFPTGTPVSRQDGATHPATYVGALSGPVS